MPSPGLSTAVSISIPLIITAICLFASAGRFDWPGAWALLILSLLSGLAMTLGRDRELSAERRNVKEGKSWDKLLVAITVLLGPMATWITAGLDQRFAWTGQLPGYVLPAGATAAALASALIAAAMRANRFFSSVVRIQKDRGHTVVDRGPYAFIRHPGYAGMLVFTLATPFILGSLRALWPAALTVLAILLRAALEDSTLQLELDGYPAYARKVRHRLLPLVW